MSQVLGDGHCKIILCGFETVGQQPILEELDGRKPMGCLKVPTKKFKQHLPDYQQQPTLAKTESKQQFFG